MNFIPSLGEGIGSQKVFKKIECKGIGFIATKRLSRLDREFPISPPYRL